MMSLSVIILSKTISDIVFKTTMNCINSLQESEEFKNNDLEILLIESNRNYLEEFSYPENVKVILPEEDFGFHKFLNKGIKVAKNKFIALCNNDLIFHKNWFSEIKKVAKQREDILSFSPIDPRKELHKFKEPFEEGYKVSQHIKGWCLVCRKELFNKLGLLDERFKFFYSDNDYALSLIFFNIKHALVTSSHIEHLHRINSKEAKSKNDTFFNEEVNLKNTPKELFNSNLSWILNDKRVLCDYLIFHKKWGSTNSLYRVINYALKLNKLKLNFLVRIMLMIKRKLKL